MPLTLVSDNGPSFVGEEFENSMEKNGVKYIHTARYHPVSNSQEERMVRTFKESLKTLTMGDLQTQLDRLLYKYRITPHSTTGKTPAQMMFNRELRSPFDLLRPGSQENQVSSQENPRDRTRSLEAGTLVWARNFGNGDKWIPGVIKKKLGNVTYEIDFKDRETSNRHIDHLKERQEGIEEVEVEVEVQEGEVTEAEAGNQVRGSIPNPTLANPFEPSTSSVRRSSRSTRKPAWAGDYVTK